MLEYGISHDDGGSAITLMFLHGVFMDRTIWRDVDGRLGGTKVHVDMPGHGASPPALPGTSLEDHAGAVRAAAHAAGIDLPRTVVVGHSWGGMVGLRLAAAGDLAGLVMTNTPLLATAGATRLGFVAQRASLAAGLPASTYGRLAARSLFGAEHRAAHPEEVEAMAGRTRRMGRHVVADTLRSVLLEPGSALGLLEGIGVPWAYVAGADDYVLDGGVAEAVGEFGHLTVVPGGHSSPVEAPQQVAAVIGALVDVVALATGRR